MWFPFLAHETVTRNTLSLIALQRGPGLQLCSGLGDALIWVLQDGGGHLRNLSKEIAMKDNGETEQEQAGNF